MTDRVAASRAQLEWPTVPLGHEDEAALDVLAGVLGQLPKENRLYGPLMYEKQLASQAAAFHGTSQLSGNLTVSLTALPGSKLDDLVAIAEEQIERLKKDGPTDSEVAKVQNIQEAGLIQGLQSATRISDFLNGNSVQYGDPLAYVAEQKRLFAVTPADVKRVANKYLGPNRVRLDVNPGPPAERAPEVAVDRKGQQSVAVEAPSVKDTFDRSKMPQPGPNPQFTPPPVVRRKLSNGLELIIAEPPFINCRSWR